MTEPCFPLQQKLVRELGVSPPLAQVLLNRGLTAAAEARRFLEASLDDLGNPFLLPGMKAGVERLALALERGEKILIYGDYDTDGVSSTALLVGFLRDLGANVTYHLPDRVSEGYGMNREALAGARAAGCTLAVTVDCGISSRDEVAWATGAGLEVIVTDHHQPPAELPPALALIDPLLGGEGASPLAGVGVAFHLAEALGRRLGLPARQGLTAWRQLDLVALGTIADSVPLRGDSRILVKHGLRAMANAGRPGLQALLEVAGLKEEPGSEEVSFALVPRLNAAGRVGRAEPAVDLLLETSPERARQLAQLLEEANRSRQAIEARVAEEALGMVAAAADLEKDKALVLSSPRWHPGVIGIVAARLAERFSRPVVLIALEGETGRGSARGIPGFDLYRALEGCRSLLLRLGGHRGAAGLSIAASSVPAFRDNFNRTVGELLEEGLPGPLLQAEAEVLFSQLRMDLAKELLSMAPFGEGNPEPLLFCRGATVLGCLEVGKQGGHLKLHLEGEGCRATGIGFRLAALKEMAAAGEPLDLIFNLGVNKWRGEENLELRVRDIRPAGATIEEGMSPPPAYPLPGAGDLPPIVSVDKRKADYLVELAGRGQKVLALVSGREEGQELAGRLRRLIQGEVLCLEEGGAGTPLGRQLVAHGLFRVAVAPGPIPVNLPPEEWALAFCRFPVGPQEWEAALHSGAGLLALLFARKELDSQTRLLERLYPDREGLAKLYLLLKGLPPEGVLMSEAQRAALLAKAGQEPGSCGLAILEELGLLKMAGQDGEWSLRLLSHSGGKLDLSSSRLFREGQELKAAWAAWAPSFLETLKTS